MNLACQAVIAEITNISFANINAADYDPHDRLQTLDSIALLRTTIWTVSV